MYKNLLYYRVTYTVSIYTIAVKNIQKKTGLKILINNMENNREALCGEERLTLFVSRTQRA